MTLDEFQKKLELLNQISISKLNSDYIPVNNNFQKSNISQDKNFFEKTGDWLGNIFQGAKNWEDGYDFGDVTKTVGASVLDATTNIYNSVAKGMEGISKLGAQGIAQVADWTGHDNFADAMRKEIANENSDAYLSPKIKAWKNKYLEPYSVLGNTTDAVAEGIGSTIFAAATSPIASPSIGKLKNIPVVMGLSSAGHEVSEAFSKEDVQDWQAWLKGGSSGTVEALSESIFGAFGIGGSELDDVLVKKATKNISNTIAKAGVTLGIKAGGESAEEFLSYAGNYLSNRLIDGISSKTDAKARFSEDWNWDEVAQSMATSFVSSALTQGPSNFMMASKGIDVTTGNTIQVQSQIDQEVQSQIHALEKKGEKVNTAKLLQIENEVTEKVYLDNAKQEMKKNIEENSNIDNTMKKGIYNAIDSSKDIKQLNVLSNVVNSYNSQNNNNQTKNIVPTADDISRQEYLDSAKQYNIDTNNEVVNSIYELAAKRGVKVRYNDTAFSDNSQTALWKVDENGNREVIINPKAQDSGKVLQSLTIHELTHDMENTDAYNSLAEIVIDYAKKQNNYDKAYQDLSNMYAKEYQNYKGKEFTSRINQELVADILGEKLGNQEFINHLVSSNTQTANGVYSWVVDKLNKLNKLTGYKFEKLYWTDVKNKFEKAFNSEFNNLTNEVKYAKKGDIIDNKNKVWYNKNGINLDYKEKYFIDGYINTNFSQMEVGTEFAKEVGDYLYVGQKIADGEFEYYAKIQIEGNENKIDNIRRSINRNGINEEGRTIDRIIQEIRNVGRTNNSDTSSSTDGGTREQVDRLYSRQSKNNNIESNTTQSIGNQSRIENNQELTPTSSFFVAKTDLTDENIKKYILPEIEGRYKNESKEKITETLEELKLQKSKIDIETDEGWDKNFEINQKIKAIENGYDNIYEFLVNHDLNELRTEEIIDKIEKKKALEEKQIKLQREIEEATPFKRAQYELIQKTNPMFDEEHVGIRSPKDIKTFEECIRDADEDSVFVWGDYTKEDAIRDLKRNKVRVYSSYAIKNGVFVSTSYRQALDYAGNDPTKVHSKEVNPSRIAWINGDEGQYASVSIAPTSSFFEAKTDNKGRQLSQQQQEKYKNVSEKLKNEKGELKTYYHGTQRADRVGNIFDPKKATSGPMAFFTDNQEIAESYSKNKQDTSISREVETEYDLFKINGKSLDDYWKSLTKEQQSQIAKEGYNIGLDDDFENIVHEENASKNSFSNQYDYYLKYEEKGNAIKALYDVFIQDGNLMFEDMQKFKDVLKYAGINNVTYLDQYKTDSKVYEVYLNVTNPFDTSEITQDIISELEKVARKAPLLQAYNADQWDKTNIKPSDWINRLKEDYKNGTTHAWTSIPDFVTNYLKSKGYDGIVDVGGKNGGQAHQVVIPFYSNQIKNVDNINPTDSDDIRYSKSNTGVYQKFLQDNFSNDGTKTYMEDIKLPSKISNLKNELRNIINISNDMDTEMKNSLLKLINEANTEAELKSYIEDLKPQKAPVKSGTIKITNYKNAKLNSKVVNNALSMIEANKQGKRTKTQWLQVAEQIGMNIKENEIDKYAYKTWSDLLPNQKVNLNRQGERYVAFTRDEWIKAVEDGYYKANREVENISRKDDINEFGHFPKEDSSSTLNEKKNNNIVSIDEKVKLRNDIEEFYNAKGTVSRNIVKNIANSLDIEIKKGANKISNTNMEKLSGKNKDPKIILIDNIFKGVNLKNSKNFRKIAIRKAMELFRDKNVKIKDTGTIAEINKSGIEKTFSGSVTPEKIQSTNNIRDIIEEGIYGYTTQNISDKSGILYHHFFTPIKSNDRNGLIRVVIKEYTQNSTMNDKYYYHQLEFIDNQIKEGNVSILPRKNGSKTGDTLPSINNIIPSEQNYVNNNENSIKNTENAPFNPEFKEKKRKRYQTIINSEVVSKEAKAIAKELMGVDTYIPESNVQQLNKADYTIEQLGVDRTLENLKSKIDGGQKILAEDIAIGDRLIQYYSKTGERQKLQDAIQYTAMVGTEAGRTVQAMSMISHQSPEGQVLWIQRSINKLNQKIASKKGGKVEVIDGRQVVNKNGKILEKVQLFEFTSDMQESILSAKSNEEMYDILDNIYEELGQQVTKNTFEKLDSWRYFSMLANPTTHVKNIVGNTAMTGTQGIKNKIAGGIEDIVAIFNKDIERTKSLVRKADAETVKFAKDDIKNVADRLGLNQNKYSPTSRIESNKREFKTDILNKTLGNAYKLNSKLLEVEDGWGLKYNYAKALSSYIASNDIDVSNITDAQLGKARNYAINQAKEATFHQESKLASALNQIGNNNEITKFVLDSTVPFKAVPINVAKTGLAYSPLQLAKSVTTDLVNLRNGNITLNQYIDNLSKGLTGTGIALIGYVLAGMGILKANGTDDDKEKYDEAQGSQTFSVTIGTQNFSLSWLAPTAIPLFIGAEMNEMLNSDKENKGNLEEEDYDKALNLVKSTVDAFANAMNPMTEMSMLSGLTSVFRSYDQDNYLVGIGTNITKSYVNQYVPTALGKIARITDEYERDTTSTKSGTIPKAIDSTKNQVMSKVPILRQMLPIKKDTWGKEVKSPTLPVRIFENTLAPYTRKEISTDKVDKYLNDLYEKTKNKDLLPDTISKTLIFDGNTYRYTNEEYNKYKAEFGKSAHDKITKVMNNKAFNKLTNDEKIDIIDEIYSDCKEEVKEKYAKVHKIEYERSDKDIEVEEEIKKGLDISNAYIYKTIISKKESDTDTDGKAISSSATKNKLKYVMSMEIDDSQKQHLINLSTNDIDYNVSVTDLKKLNGNYLTYLQQSGKTPENGGMTAREQYIQLINSGIPVTQLNKFYSEISDIEGQKDSNGDTISGSKKQAVFDYVNSLSLSVPQKQILLARQYESFAKLYYNDILNYINNLDLKESEKYKIYESVFKKLN